MSAVVTAVRAMVTRHRLQCLVIGVVALLATTTTVLAAGLLSVSVAPFTQAFTRQSGAHVTATFDPALTTPQALAATADAPGTSAAGPFEVAGVWLSGVSEQSTLGATTIVGRSDPGGPVDRIVVDEGRWVSGPGEIVLAADILGMYPITVGDTVSADLPGAAELTIVGVAGSVTASAGGWVWPTQTDLLHAEAAATGRQMLYRFSSLDDAATDDAADTAADARLAEVTAGLPAGALTSSSTYVDASFATSRSAAAMTPYVVAFAILGLTMSVLIVANVVSGSVVAGYRAIGVRKTLGFTPRQVTAVHVGAALVPALAGCLAGLVLGDVLAIPVLDRTSHVYGVSGSAGLPWWVDPVVGCVLAAVVAAAALAPAVRAGRLPAVRAIAVGRAPRAGRGYRLRRWIAALPLPRPVGFGLGTPLSRPARSFTTLLAVLLGAMTVVFALGLYGSLSRVYTAISRTGPVPVEVSVPAGQVPPGSGSGSAAGTGAAAATAEVRAVVESQPGTERVVGTRQATVTMAECDRPVAVVGYDGDASWTGYVLADGRWYGGEDEVVAASYLLHHTGIQVGDMVTLRVGERQRQVRVVGAVFDMTNHGLALTGADRTLSGLVPTITPNRFQIGLADGVDADRYSNDLTAALDGNAHVLSREKGAMQKQFTIMFGLLAMLTVLLSTVAALGVFNTVVLNTRERVHEIAVLKSIGMTPRQVRVMAIVSVAAVGLVAGLLALPAGYALHHVVVPVMGNATGMGSSDVVLDVYSPLELAGLGLAGIVIAVLGALVPAGWAARTRCAAALRAE